MEAPPEAEQRFNEHLKTLGYSGAQLVVDSSGTLVTEAPKSGPWHARLPVLHTDTGEAPVDLQMGAMLGEGGMGRVFAAQQVALGREVAVKVLREEAEDWSNAQLLREALVAGRLEHPNIVPVYLLGVSPQGAPMFVMRKITGVPWSRVLRDPAKAPEFFSRARQDALGFNLSIFARVCEALHFAHARGVIHRDVKPDNVMLGAFGEVYLVDWGLAVSLEDDGVLPTASAATTLSGTPLYMAPEMAACRADQLDARTDVFLLGAVLYEVVTGHAPFRAPTILAQLVRAYDCLYDPLPPTVSPELTAIITRALSRERDARFPSADALRRAVLDYLEHRASWTLSTAADRRAAELTELLDRPHPGDGETARAQELFTECRYGYRQALEAWGENLEARNGLQALIERMIAYELSRENVQTALALLPQLPTPNPELAARVEQARRRALDARELLSRLEALQHDTDTHLGSGARGQVIAGLGGFWLSASLIADFLDRSGRWRFGYPEAVAAIVLNLLLTLAAIAWVLRQQQTNAAQRKLLVGSALMGTGLVTHWLWSYLLEMSLTQGLVQFLWWVSGGWVLVAALFDSRAAVTAISLGAGAFAVALWPRQQIVWFGLSAFVGFTGLGALWMRDARRARDEVRRSRVPPAPSAPA